MSNMRSCRVELQDDSWVAICSCGWRGQKAVMEQANALATKHIIEHSLEREYMEQKGIVL